MNDLHQLLAPLRETRAEIPVISAEPLLDKARRDASRRRRAALAMTVLALLVAGVGASAALVGRVRGAGVASRPSLAEPEGQLVASLRLASGVQFQVRGTPDAASVPLVVFETGPDNPDGWVARLTWAPNQGTDLQASGSYVFGLTAVRSSAVALTSRDQRREALTAPLDGVSGTFYAVDTPVELVGGRPAQTITATADVNGVQQQIGQLGSAVALAAAHSLASGNHPVEFAKTLDTGPGAGDHLLWLGVDKWWCTGRRLATGELAASSCREPGTGVEARRLPGWRYFVAPLPLTAGSATIRLAPGGKAYPLTVYGFASGFLGVLVLGPGELGESPPVLMVGRLRRGSVIRFP